MLNAKKRCRIISLSVCFILLGSFLIFLITCVSFRQTISVGGTGECISVAFFEKQKMQTVDKVVLTDEYSKKVVTITDMDLIDELVKEITVANRANLGCAKTNSRQIDLFSGDNLIRSMKWSRCCEDTIYMYNADSTHWILFSGYPLNRNHTAHEGWAEISKELLNKLNVLLEEA